MSSDAARFRHPDFREHSFEEVPLDRDVFLIDERWIPDYEAARIQMFNGGDYIPVGYISYAAIRGIGQDSLELSWYPNVSDRFHELSIRLPRDAFVTCIDAPGWDEKPHVFVKGAWLSALHLRPYSAFALIDAIGVKNALSSGQLAGPALVRLRDRIDLIAEHNPAVAFVSFADSLLIKVNWFVGKYDTDVSYSYEPESLVALVPAIAQVFKEEVGLHVYAAIAQGVNEYEDPGLLHVSKTGNHLSLNSLGLPFAQLLAIDGAARSAIHEGRHAPAELYLDEHFFHSLRFIFQFDRDRLPRAPYSAPLTSTPAQYVHTSVETILRNLDPNPPNRPKRKDS